MEVIKLSFKESNVIVTSNNIEKNINPVADLQELKYYLKKTLKPEHKAIVVECKSQSLFSKTVYQINGKLIDVRLALMDEIKLPILTQEEVEEAGLYNAITEFHSYYTWHLDYHGVDKSKKEGSKESLKWTQCQGQSKKNLLKFLKK